MLHVGKNALFVPQMTREGLIQMRDNPANAEHPVHLHLKEKSEDLEAMVSLSETLKPLGEKAQALLTPIAEPFRNFFGLIMSKIAGNVPKERILDLTSLGQADEKNPVKIGEAMKKVGKELYSAFNNIGDAISSTDADRIKKCFQTFFDFDLEKFINTMTPEIAALYSKALAFDGNETKRDQ